MAENSQLDENSLNDVAFRDSGLVANIGGIDARIFFIFLTLLFVHSWTVFYICMGIVVFFWIVAHFRMTPEIFITWIRFSLGNSRRSWQTKRLLRIRGDMSYPG